MSDFSETSPADEPEWSAEDSANESTPQANREVSRKPTQFPLWAVFEITAAAAVFAAVSRAVGPLHRAGFVAGASVIALIITGTVVVATNTQHTGNTPVFFFRRNCYVLLCGSIALLLGCTLVLALNLF